MHLFLTILPFALTGFGLITALVLFLSVKREVHTQARRNRAHLDEVLEQLKKPEPAPEKEPAPFMPMLRAGMNLSKRVQALRLHRRGEDVSHISAALAVPRREIELLIRVQQLATDKHR